MMNSKTRGFLYQNEELCIENEESCIKTDELLQPARATYGMAPQVIQEKW